MNKTTTNLGMIALAICSVALIGYLTYQFSDSHRAINKGLLIQAGATNSSCPKKISDNITMLGSEAGDMHYTTKFRVTGFDAGRWKSFIDVVTEDTKLGISENTKSKRLIDRGVIFTVVYVDENDIEHLRFDITKDSLTNR